MWPQGQHQITDLPVHPEIYMGSHAKTKYLRQAARFDRTAFLELCQVKIDILQPIRINAIICWTFTKQGGDCHILNRVLLKYPGGPGNHPSCSSLPGPSSPFYSARVQPQLSTGNVLVSDTNGKISIKNPSIRGADVAKSFTLTPPIQKRL